MDRAVCVHSGKLLWSGEHWIIGLRTEEMETPSAWVSLFHTRYSPAGEGNAAQIIIPGAGGINVICTDQRDVCTFTTDRFFARGSFFEPQAPVVEARFQRTGDIRRDPAWVIETTAFRVVARWQVTEAPVIADGTFRSGTEHYTVLFFANEASVELNGRQIAGQAYLRDLWRPSIGGDRSSAVFALAETLVELPA